jgi:hypothetical protein
MNIQVEGRNGTKKRYVQYLSIVMAKQLGLLSMNIDLTIFLTKEVGDNALTAVNGNEYRMILNPSHNARDLGIELGHEMVHVKQYARGLLKNLGNNKRMWVGKIYPASTPYLEQPWEIQAFSQQELVFRLACEA